MSKSVISVEGLSKRYRLGRKLRPRNFGEAFVNSLKSPFNRLISHGEADTDDFWALKDVNFEVPRGEVVGIIGRNGAGKSTLLKILSRITPPTSGQIALHGRVASLLEVGTGFHPELTGRENIYLNGAMLGMQRTEIARKFDEIVDFSEVEQFLDTPVKRYSSGMYVRLAFAVAAHLEPEILIVDEVLAVGDADFQKKCLGKMKDVSRGTGRTVLFVSHNMAAIQSLCSAAVCLKRGAVEYIGGVSAAIETYLGDASSNKSGHFDVRQNLIRTSKLQWIKSVTLLNRHDIPSSTFSSTSQMKIRIEIVPPRSVQNPRMAIAISDSLGHRLCASATYFQFKETGTFESCFHATCNLPRLSLGPGRYLLSVSVAEKHEGLLDSLDDLLWFDVEWDDAYGNGEAHYADYGPLIVNATWAIDAES